MTDLPGLDWRAVSNWMVEHVPGCVAPVTFSLIAGGHSNITYGAVDASGHEYVVRRPPLGTSVTASPALTATTVSTPSSAKSIVRMVPVTLALCAVPG